MIGPEKITEKTDTHVEHMTYKTSENIDQIGMALSIAQGKMGHAAKDGNNTFHKSGYPTLASALACCRQALSESSISVVQIPTSENSNSITITTILIHKSGQWISGVLTLPTDKKTAQGAGSSITYARRYTLMAFVGVAPADDDDGNAASGLGQKKYQQEQPKIDTRPPPAAFFDKTNSADIEGIENVFKEEGLVIAHWKPIKERMHGKLKTEARNIVKAAVLAQVNHKEPNNGDS